MKQSLIALAVAGAFAAPAAMAAATIGGELDVAYQQFDNGTNSGLQANDTPQPLVDGCHRRYRRRNVRGRAL